MIVDRLGHPIQVGDRVLYPGYASSRHITGIVKYASESAIEIKPETEYTWITDDSVRICDVFRSPEVCLVLNYHDPRVTVELLKV